MGTNARQALRSGTHQIVRSGAFEGPVMGPTMPSSPASRTIAMNTVTTDPHDALAIERRTIEALNQGYLRAGEHGDVAWYREHLADDFLSSAVDGSLSDKPAFLERIALKRAGSGFVAH